MGRLSDAYFESDKKVAAKKNGPSDAVRKLRLELGNLNAKLDKPYWSSTARASIKQQIARVTETLRLLEKKP